MEKTNGSSFDECHNMIYKAALTIWNKMKKVRPEVEFDDVLGEAYFVYSWSLAHFDNSKKTKFTTYLYIQLNQRLLDYYFFTDRPMNLYEDTATKFFDEEDTFESMIESVDYDLSDEVKNMLECAEECLSYEALDILKFILNRSWETKNNRKQPSISQICKFTGYPKEVVDSCMGEIHSFWMKNNFIAEVA